MAHRRQTSRAATARSEAWLRTIIIAAWVVFIVVAIATAAQAQPMPIVPAERFSTEAMQAEAAARAHSLYTPTAVVTVSLPAPIASVSLVPGFDLNLSAAHNALGLSAGDTALLANIVRIVAGLFIAGLLIATLGLIGRVSRDHVLDDFPS